MRYRFVPTLVCAMLGCGPATPPPTAVPEVLFLANMTDFSRNAAGHPLTVPLAKSVLTATNSSSPVGAEIIAYQWSLEARHGASVPMGSNVLLGSPDSVETEVVYAETRRELDSAGLYQIALRVQDFHGQWSNWETVTIEARPTASLQIELTWDKPEGDLDLHLIRGGDRSSHTSDQDCHFAKCKTDTVDAEPTLSWGSEDTDDDPR